MKDCVSNVLWRILSQFMDAICILTQPRLLSLVTQQQQTHQRLELLPRNCSLRSENDIHNKPWQNDSVLTSLFLLHSLRSYCYALPFTFSATFCASKRNPTLWSFTIFPSRSLSGLLSDYLSTPGLKKEKEKKEQQNPPPSPPLHPSP